MGLKRQQQGGCSLKDKQGSFIFVTGALKLSLALQEKALGREVLGDYPKLLVYFFFLIMEGGTREGVPLSRGQGGPPSRRGRSDRDKVVVQLIFD